MADPLTPNIGLAVPTRGSDVGTWDVPINGDMQAIDGMFGGILPLTIGAANITLTVPAGFTPAPAANSIQSQNGIIRLTGAQSASIVLKIPVTGYFIIDNQVTTDAFVVQIQAAGAANQICVPAGMVTHIYVGTAQVFFVDLGFPGSLLFMAGDTNLPLWVAGCTTKPYLLCDGAVYASATFPALARKLGATFGGNGSTTFGVPDLRARVPLSLDGGTGRVTSAGSGINGLALGAAGGSQNQTVGQGQLPNVGLTVSGSASVVSTANNIVSAGGVAGNFSQTGGFFNALNAPSGISVVVSTGSISGGTSSINGGVGQTPVVTMPPVQVAGVYVIKT